MKAMTKIISQSTIVQLVGNDRVLRQGRVMMPYVATLDGEAYGSGDRHERNLLAYSGDGHQPGSPSREYGTSDGNGYGNGIGHDGDGKPGRDWSWRMPR